MDTVKTLSSFVEARIELGSMHVVLRRGSLTALGGAVAVLFTHRMLWSRFKQSWIYNLFVVNHDETMLAIRQTSESLMLTILDVLEDRCEDMNMFFTKVLSRLAVYVQKMDESRKLLNWHNFHRILRIFKIWEKVSTDFIIYEYAAVKPNVQAFDGRATQIRPISVRLRWRKGPMSRRAQKRGFFELEDTRYQVIETFHTDQDGSFSVKQILDHWKIEKVDFLVPGRWEVFEPNDPDRLSPLALHILMQGNGYITVVEYEDFLTRMRHRFRQWYRGSFVAYVLRWLCFLLTSSTVLGLIGYLSFTYSFWVFPISLYLLARKLFFNPRMRINWYDFWWNPVPERRKRGWLRPEDALRLLQG